MKTCLLVTSLFPPSFPADMHRARMLARNLPRYGWDPIVLCADDSFMPIFLDPEGSRYIGSEKVIKVKECFKPFFSALNVTGIQWRAWLPMFSAGLKLLRRQKIDLIYLTNAQFGFFTLGPAWKKIAGTPFVLDFHDPWYVPVRRYETYKPNWRTRLTSPLEPFLERCCVQAAAGIVAVSDEYGQELKARYPKIHSLPTLSSPFAGDENDIRIGAELAEKPVRDETIRLFYIGAGGRLMTRAFEAICAGLKDLIASGHPEAARVKIYLHGTEAGKKPGDFLELSAVAARHGLADHIVEDPRRVPYTRALAMAMGADGLLLLGVDAPGYIPSKLYTYALTGKPLLGAFRKGSPASRHFLGPPPIGEAVEFNDDGTFDVVESRAVWMRFLELRPGPVISRIEDNTADSMSRHHAQFFDKIFDAKRDKIGNDHP